MRVIPLTPTLGAEIEDLDLRDLDDERFTQFHRYWLDHKVLFLRDQALDLDQLLAFSSRFGEPMQLPFIKPYENYPCVIRVLKEANETGMGVFGGDWHSDFSFLEAPPSASVLYADEVPDTGGDTLWIDMGAAFASLAEEQKTLLRECQAIHSGTPYGIANAPDESTQFKGSIEIERNNPEADRETSHPAVCRHPETGQEILFINPTYTTRLDGLSAAHSQELLANLYAHCTRPEFACRFKWRPGSIAIWDNRATLHYAVNDYDGQRRCLYRTAIRGDVPRAAV